MGIFKTYIDEVEHGDVKSLRYMDRKCVNSHNISVYKDVVYSLTVIYHEIVATILNDKDETDLPDDYKELIENSYTKEDFEKRNDFDKPNIDVIAFHVCCYYQDYMLESERSSEFQQTNPISLRNIKNYIQSRIEEVIDNDNKKYFKVDNIHNKITRDYGYSRDLLCASPCYKELCEVYANIFIYDAYDFDSKYEYNYKLEIVTKAINEFKEEYFELNEASNYIFSSASKLESFLKNNSYFGKKYKVIRDNMTYVEIVFDKEMSEKFSLNRINT